MRHGQIGEGFQDAGEFADRPARPKQGPREAQHLARGGGKWLDQIKKALVSTISLIHQIDSTIIGEDMTGGEALIAGGLAVSSSLPLSYNSLICFSSGQNSS
jgi:hypothetical protein